MARYSRNDQAGVELPKAKLNRESLGQALELFKYLRPYRARFGAALLALMAGSVLSLAFPYLAGRIIDGVMPTAGAGSGHLVGADRTALLLVGILALQAGFSYFQALSLATAGQRCLVDLRRDTYARLISLPMSFFAQRRVGELASRLSADLIQMEDTLTTILPQFLRQSILLIGGIGLIAATSLKLTGVMLARGAAILGHPRQRRGVGDAAPQPRRRPANRGSGPGQGAASCHPRGRCTGR